MGLLGGVSRINKDVLIAINKQVEEFYEKEEEELEKTTKFIGLGNDN